MIAVSTNQLTRSLLKAQGQLAALSSIGQHIGRNPKFHGDEHLPAFEVVHNNLTALLDDLESNMQQHDRQLSQIFGKVMTAKP